MAQIVSLAGSVQDFRVTPSQLAMLHVGSVPVFVHAVPSAPLPEGAVVEIRVTDVSPPVPPELQEELAAWQQASANSLALVERLARESERHEKG